jgi:hypothetical protein
VTAASKQITIDYLPDDEGDVVMSDVYGHISLLGPGDIPRSDLNTHSRHTHTTGEHNDEESNEYRSD